MVIPNLIETICTLVHLFFSFLRLLCFCEFCKTETCKIRLQSSLFSYSGLKIIVFLYSSCINILHYFNGSVRSQTFLILLHLSTRKQINVTALQYKKRWIICSWFSQNPLNPHRYMPHFLSIFLVGSSFLTVRPM